MTNDSCNPDRRRIRKGDRPVLDIWPNSLSYNELHAIALGGSAGLLLGERGLAVRTLLREPWYALTAFAAAYALARHLYRD